MKNGSLNYIFNKKWMYNIDINKLSSVLTGGDE